VWPFDQATYNLFHHGASNDIIKKTNKSIKKSFFYVTTFKNTSLSIDQGVVACRQKCLHSTACIQRTFKALLMNSVEFKVFYTLSSFLTIQMTSGAASRCEQNDSTHIQILGEGIAKDNGGNHPADPAV